MTADEAAALRAWLKEWHREVYGARWTWPEPVERYWLRVHREIRRVENHAEA